MSTTGTRVATCDTAREPSVIRRPYDAYSLPCEVIASLSPIPPALWFRELDIRDRALVLRHAVPAEYGEVGEVLAAAFTTGCASTPEYVAGLHAIAERAQTSNVWVVADEVGILGAVLTPQPRHLGSDVFTVNIPFTFNILGVGPRGRGLGLGRVLADHAVRVARSLGLRRVDIHSGPQMTAAHRVYVDYGFVRRIEQETAVVDSHQRLLAFSYRIVDPADPAPRIDRVAGEPSGDPFETLEESVSSVSIETLRPVGVVSDSGRFLAASPELPGLAPLPESAGLGGGALRLVVPASSPRSWGAVLGARLAAPGLVNVSFVESGTPRLLDADGKLVSDDWAWISRSVAVAAGSGLYPVARREEIDVLEGRIDEEVIGALEQVIFSASQPVRDAVERLLFARLGVLDLELGGSGGPYLLGDEPTTADLALFGALVGWDLHYRAHLGWGAASLVDYPKLWAWARRLLASDGLVSADDRIRLGLEAAADGSYREPWGPASPVDGVDDIRAAWREPVEG